MYVCMYVCIYPAGGLGDISIYVQPVSTYDLESWVLITQLSFFFFVLFLGCDSSSSGMRHTPVHTYIQVRLHTGTGIYVDSEVLLVHSAVKVFVVYRPFV